MFDFSKGLIAALSLSAGAALFGVASADTGYIFRTPVSGLKAPPSCASGSSTFSYTGDYQYFTVPDGCAQIRVEVYGAGGGPVSGSILKSKGGYVSARLDVDAGEKLKIMVGQNGAWTGDGSRSDYSGGGRSALLAISNEPIVVASGGGGGSLGGNGGSPANDGGGMYGGRGGTLTAGGEGGAGSGRGYEGYDGGSMRGGGLLAGFGGGGQGGQGPSCGSGSSVTGISGGGGGGYFGGGQGGVQHTGTNLCRGSSGGGGSSYASPEAKDIQMVTGGGSSRGADGKAVISWGAKN